MILPVREVTNASSIIHYSSSLYSLFIICIHDIGTLRVLSKRNVVVVDVVVVVIYNFSLKNDKLGFTIMLILNFFFLVQIYSL